nr:dipeptidase [Actinomycetes bacterium]
MDYPDALRHALVLLTQHPVLDTHNDLPFALRSRAGGDATAAVGALVEVGEGLDGTQTDLPRLRLGRVGGQFWSAYVPASWEGDRAVAATLEQIGLIREMVAVHPHELAWCETADDVVTAMAEGRIASLVGLEGGHSVGGSLETLRTMHQLGARYLTLTHNDTTAWADSATDEPRHGGLSDEGRDVVRELNRLGMLVDLSHV